MGLSCELRGRGLLCLGIMLLAICDGISGSQQYTLDSGKLYFKIKQTSNSSPELFQFNYDSSIKSELRLSQSSKIEIEAKLKFSSAQFKPQMITFRLKHEKYDKLTQPVLAVYDEESENFKCVVDLGDPKTIQPYSDLYLLELIIADELLKKNVRNTIAKIRISFKYSLSEDKIPHKNSTIEYHPPNLIQTKAPEERVDPPQTFTTFVLVIMTTFSAFFLYGVFAHLKGNFKNIPTSSPFGMILNLALIVLFILNLVFLAKFWLEWNFLKTIGNVFWLLFVTACVSNYALHYVKKPIDQ